MNEITAGVNWLAVGVGTVLGFLLGWLWYSPMLFGKAWAKGVGQDLGSASAMPAAAMTLQLLGTFLLAWVVGVTAAQNALLTVLLVIVMLAVFIASNGAFVKKSNQAIGIEVSFLVAMSVVMIIVQGIF
jgi:hypothetical protein